MSKHHGSISKKITRFASHLTIVKQLTEFILTKIVAHPDSVEVAEEKNDNQVGLKMRVHADDMPRVIGKGGKVIRSIRNLVKVAARKKNLWVSLELEE